MAAWTNFAKTGNPNGVVDRDREADPLAAARLHEAFHQDLVLHAADAVVNPLHSEDVQRRLLGGERVLSREDKGDFILERFEFHNGVDMVVQPGEVVTLLGRNGAGKTTALNAT